MNSDLFPLTEEEAAKKAMFYEGDLPKHYTRPGMAADLLKILNLSPENTLLDAGSGKNKIWFKLAPCREKYECEIEDGNDFFQWKKKVDWVVGNPPYHMSYNFTEHALTIAQKGIAWLLNNQCLNSQLTPRRIKIVQDAGFYLQKIHVVADKRWFGRYYFLIFTKEENHFITTNLKTYAD